MNISKLGQLGGAHHASSTSKPAASGAHGQAISEDRGGAKGSGADVDSINPRLADFASKIDARFKSALANESLSPRQRAALEKAQEKFHQGIQRLDDAHFSGAESTSRRTPGYSLDSLLEQFTASVNHILEGQGSNDPKPTPPPPSVDAEVASRSRGRGPRGPVAGPNVDNEG